ncbi:hypothetical protein M441DRAFT_240096 [Trichoderma asperellum CBS 433.97]|uniref:Uncharacterized protein n=1 Tax=Trichoderma asperellum (strain ATCC 204424 / CBS 433.97 / NBRC 101777) TaxID=1042311 RepID=A0A2T3Z213_TRIA4|nr:hypothetical protein M441DRAFT_240096 [Trichoderma asperellum CBS 433.97]PTB38852.1 hypothetical protein M441DRAFT_240096 [Trichoderma asperellum CBS 433.97]
MRAYCITISFPLFLFLFLSNDMMIRRLKDGFSQTRPTFYFFTFSSGLHERLWSAFFSFFLFELQRHHF